MLYRVVNVYVTARRTLIPSSYAVTPIRDESDEDVAHDETTTTSPKRVLFRYKLQQVYSTGRSRSVVPMPIPSVVDSSDGSTVNCQPSLGIANPRRPFLFECSLSRRRRLDSPC